MKKKCKHKKVYDDTVLYTCPPKKRWVCSICKETGIDTIGSIPVISLTNEEIKERFGKI